MRKNEYLTLQDQRRRVFIDWLFSFIEVEKGMKLSMFARAIGMDYRTIENIKKGGADRRKLCFHAC